MKKRTLQKIGNELRLKLGGNHKLNLNVKLQIKSFCQTFRKLLDDCDRLVDVCFESDSIFKVSFFNNKGPTLDSSINVLKDFLIIISFEEFMEMINMSNYSPFMRKLVFNNMTFLESTYDKYNRGSVLKQLDKYH